MLNCLLLPNSELFTHCRLQGCLATNTCKCQYGDFSFVWPLLVKFYSLYSDLNMFFYQLSVLGSPKILSNALMHLTGNKLSWSWSSMQWMAGQTIRKPLAVVSYTHQIPGRTPTTCYHQSVMEKPWNDADSIEALHWHWHSARFHPALISTLVHCCPGPGSQLTQLWVEWIIETVCGTLAICCHLSPPPVSWPGQGLPTMFGICHKPFFLTSPSIDLLCRSYLLLYLFDASWLNLRIWIWVKKIVELEIFPWLSNIM